jgi:hypothetical protein
VKYWLHMSSVPKQVANTLQSLVTLAEKPSVGQRHVYLNPRRVADIRALVDRGELPADLRLPGTG